MASDMKQGSRLMRFAGWCLAVVGGGWLGLLFLALVLADDIGSTYVVIVGALTGPPAFLLLILGLSLIWRERSPLVTRVSQTTTDH